MNITIDEHAGFCPGVKNAIKIVEENIEQGESVTALGSLIHNELEIDRLKNAGLKEINQDDFESGKIDPARLLNETLLVRAHGISPDLEKKIKNEKISCINATCSLVSRSQKFVKEYFDKGYQIIIVGKTNHPEVKGLMGYCENQGTIVYDTGDENKISPSHKRFLIAQTTIDQYRFDYFEKILKKGVDEFFSKNTICPVVTKRQRQVVEFAKQNDVLIFVGGKESSNSKILFELCKNTNLRSHFVSAFDEIQKDWFKDEDSVGLTGGASTPIWQLEEIKKLILLTFNLNQFSI